MDVVENWAAQYDELDVLAKAVREIHSAFRSLGAPIVPTSGYDDEVRASVAQELASFREALEKECGSNEEGEGDERGPPSSPSKPRQSPAGENGTVASLLTQLEEDLRRDDSTSRWCDPGSLKSITEGAIDIVPPDRLRKDLPGWVSDYLRNPLQRFRDFEAMQQQRASSSSSILSSPTPPAAQQGLIKRIKAFSEEICQPGFNPSRVELLNARSMLVQQLLAALSERSGRGDSPSSAAQMMALMEECETSFDQALSESLLHQRGELARTERATAHLDSQLEALDRYLHEKSSTSHIESLLEEHEKRRSVRAMRFSTTLQIIVEAFSGIYEAVQEVRDEATTLKRLELERRVAREEGLELRRKLSQRREQFRASAQNIESSVETSLKFGDWLKQVHKSLHRGASEHHESLRQVWAERRAQREALRRASVEQVREQCVQLQAALDCSLRERAACEQALSVLEFSKPTEAQVRAKLAHLEQIKASARWQAQEIEALRGLEQGFVRSGSPRTKDGGSPVSEATQPPDNNDFTDDDHTGNEVSSEVESSAEAWVESFFFTRWRRDSPLVSEETSESLLRGLTFHSERRSFGSPQSRRSLSNSQRVSFEGRLAGETTYVVRKSAGTEESSTAVASPLSPTSRLKAMEASEGGGPPGATSVLRDALAETVPLSPSKAGSPQRALVEESIAQEDEDDDEHEEETNIEKGGSRASLSPNPGRSPPRQFGGTPVSSGGQGAKPRMADRLVTLANGQTRVIEVRQDTSSSCGGTITPAAQPIKTVVATCLKEAIPARSVSTERWQAPGRSASPMPLVPLLSATSTTMSPTSTTLLPMTQEVPSSQFATQSSHHPLLSSRHRPPASAAAMALAATAATANFGQQQQQQSRQPTPYPAQQLQTQSVRVPSHPVSCNLSSSGGSLQVSSRSTGPRFSSVPPRRPSSPCRPATYTVQQQNPQVASHNSNTNYTQVVLGSHLNDEQEQHQLPATQQLHQAAPSAPRPQTSLSQAVPLQQHWSFKLGDVGRPNSDLLAWTDIGTNRQAHSPAGSIGASGQRLRVQARQSQGGCPGAPCIAPSLVFRSSSTGALRTPAVRGGIAGLSGAIPSRALVREGPGVSASIEASDQSR